MREMIKMVVVLTILSSFSGGLLAALRDGTKEKIENTELELVKGPAVRTILEGASNDPVADRFKIKDGKAEYDFFVGIFNGEPSTVAFEATGKGYGDKFGLMVGIDLTEDKLVGVSVTTHKETPGLGGNAKDDPSFAAQFAGMAVNNAANESRVSKDGGKISAISGATITSRAVCLTANDACALYLKLKPQITEQIKEVVK
jgi:Na+-translocating ferredoxin:NAD+ oxidoreductase subunit G